MSKINKLGKSTFVIAILSFILVAVLTFGGTYAYFSAKSGVKTGTVTMGTLKLTDTGFTASEKIFTEGSIAQPNQQLFGATGREFSVTTDATTNISYYTRVKFTVTVTPAVGATHATHGAELTDNMNAIDILTIEIKSKAWEKGVALASGDNAKTESSYYYYQLAPTKVTTAGATTEKFMVDNLQVKPILGVDDCTYWMGATVTVSIQFEVLQADYLKDGVTAGAAFANGAAAEAAWTTALTGVQA